MNIKYKVIERGEPGVVGGGVKKYYAAAKTKGAVDIDDMTFDIEKISTVSGADIRAVLYALVDVSSSKLADGNIVRLGDLGSLRVSISSRGYDAPSDVNATAIKGTKVVFSPGKKLRMMKKTLTYKMEA